jgi:hypothetical protein
MNAECLTCFFVIGSFVINDSQLAAACLGALVRPTFRPNRSGCSNAYKSHRCFVPNVERKKAICTHHASKVLKEKMETKKTIDTHTL